MCGIVASVQHCQTLLHISVSFLMLGICCTSLLFFYRVRAVYGNSKIITGFFGFLWLSIFGATFVIPFSVSGEVNLSASTPFSPTSSQNACIMSSRTRLSHICFFSISDQQTNAFLQSHGHTIFCPSWSMSSMTASFSFLFPTASFGTQPSEIVGARGQSRFLMPTDSLDCRGVFCKADSSITCDLCAPVLPATSWHLPFSATVGVGIVYAVMILTPDIPAVYHTMLAIPKLALQNAMACRVYRAVKLGFIKDPPSTHIGTTLRFNSAPSESDHELPFTRPTSDKSRNVQITVNTTHLEMDLKQGMHTSLVEEGLSAPDPNHLGWRYGFGLQLFSLCLQKVVNTHKQ